MRVKDMFSKKNKIFFYTFFLIFIYSKMVFSETKLINETIEYLESLKFFSGSFVQIEGNEVSEGKLFIGKNRIRVEYLKPSKILIILADNKAMYYNYELDEDEFFNPQNTPAWFFYDIFNNPEFFEDSYLFKDNNTIIITKEVFNDLGRFNIKILFENNPFLIRKIELVMDDSLLELSLFDHNYNDEFDKSFFKLINPTFFD